MTQRLFVLLLSTAIVGLLVHPADSAEVDPWPPPSPYRILGIATDRPPLIDAAAACLPNGGAEAGEAALFEAISSARSHEKNEDAIAQLSTALVRGGSARGRACAELELSRLRLHAGFLPEARAHALRALRAFGDSEPPAPLLRAARFYRAESLYFSHDIAAAAPLYAALERGKTPVSRASAVRLADLEMVERRDDESLRNIVNLLEQASTNGADLAAWGPRIAELSLPLDLPNALAWIERAPESLDDAGRAAVAVRRADLLRRLGKSDESHDSLRQVADGGRTAAIRQLAVVRLIDLENRRDDAARRQLALAATSALPGMRAYARGVLARHFVAAGELGPALEVLVRLVHDGMARRFVPTLPALFDQVIAGLTDTARCDSMVAAIGGRRGLLLRNASTPAPFLRLGDCYFELGLRGAALDTYRGVAKAFGPTAVSQVTLRIARAEHAVGRLAPARAAARGGVSSNVEPNGAWRLLYAEILLEEDQPLKALEVLEPVLRRSVQGTAAPDIGHRAIFVSAQAAARGGASAAVRDLLTQALPASSEAAGAGHELAAAALVTADLQRAAGNIDTANGLYERAFAALEPGPLRSRAGYWHGVLSGDDGRARDIWSRIAGDDDPWARLAANEIELGEGRAAVGMRSRIVEIRTRTSEAGDPR